MPPRRDKPSNRARPPKTRRAGRPWLLLRLGVALAGFMGCAGLMTALFVYAAYAGELTTPEWRERLRSFDSMVAVGVTRFEAADGSLVGETFSERRLAVAWEEIPRPLILAFLAVEDARFFEHAGIDLRGVARAMVTNVLAGNLKEGASTITQQLAKTLVGSQRALSRKVLEAILARRMEDGYTKEQILTWYLNVIYLGHGSYGIKAAAQNYFRKPLADLNLTEMATLAGLPQSPSRVNPWVNPEASRRRTAHVLRKMVEQGWLSEADAAAAAETAVRVYPLRDPLREQAPAYTETVRRQGPRLFGPDWLHEGLTLTLGLDPATQRAGEQALTEGLEAVQARQGFKGPLGRMEAEPFLARNEDHARQRLERGEHPSGARVLARVEAVTRERADLQISAHHRATLALKDAAWATPWTEQPVDARGRRDRKARVSFDGTLKDLTAALSPGDIILVEILPAPAAAKAPAAKGGKQRGKKKKGRARAAPAEADTSPEPPLPAAGPEANLTHAVRLVPLPDVGGALVSLHPDGRTVDALIGSHDFDRSEVNRVFSLRQLGSLMKPFIYGLAYELSLPPSALLSGAPFRDGRYNPTGHRAKEDMFVWDGLVNSENSVSLRVLRFVLDRVEPVAYKAWGEALGLSRPLEGHTSEVLGMDQTVWDAFKAFATFASVGLKVSPELVLKAVDRDGRVVSRGAHPLQVHLPAHDTLLATLARAAAPPRRMIRRSTAHLVARNLAAVVTRGTARAARKLPFTVAGKTGTLAYDVWFAGFSDRRTTLVWFGDDRRTRTLGPSERDNRVLGANGPLPVWIDFMGAVDDGPKGAPRGEIGGPQPPDVEELRIDPETGLLALPEDRKVRVLPHRVGTGPTEHRPRPEEALNVGDLEAEF